MLAKTNYMVVTLWVNEDHKPLLMITLIAYLYTQIKGSTLGAALITESKKQYAETKECNTATLDQVRYMLLNFDMILNPGCRPDRSLFSFLCAIF